MTVTKTQEQAEAAKSLRALKSKWGKETIEVDGFTAIPNILLERQQALKIDAIKLNILLVLLKHWWEKPKMPYPAKTKIADIVGRDVSTVQRQIRAMEKQGLLSRNKRYQTAGGQTSNEYDLSGLIEQLHSLSVQRLKERANQKEDDDRKRRGHVE